MNAKLRGEGAWSDFWSAGSDAGAALTSPARRAELESFWRGVFASCRLDESGRMLDIASGAAAVGVLSGADRKGEPADRTGPFVAFLDYSLDALARVPRARGRFGAVQADARALPFEDGAFDLVVSQFGVEYAGKTAFGEAARMIRPGGAFVAVCHRRDSPIARECAHNADLAEKIEATGVFRAAHAALEASYALAELSRDPPADPARDKAAQAALNRAAALVRAAPLSPAKTDIERLVADLTRLLNRRLRFARSDASHWLDSAERSLGLYAARMRAMTRAALGPKDVEIVRKRMADAGVSRFEASAFSFAGEAETAAWRIEGRREY